MKPNEKSKFFWLVVALLGVAAVLFLAPKFKIQQLSLPNKGDSNESETSIETQDTNDAIRESKTNIRSDLTAKEKLENRVRFMMAQDPISAMGVNEASIVFYSLTKEDVKKVTELIASFRLDIATTIVNGLEDLNEVDNAGRGAVFRGSEETAREYSKRFQKSLEEIGGPEFARQGIKALENDIRFLGGGARDVYLLVNPGDLKASPQVEGVRMEIMTPDKSQSSSWEGDLDILKSEFLIDADL